MDTLSGKERVFALFVGEASLSLSARGGEVDCLRQQNEAFATPAIAANSLPLYFLPLELISELILHVTSTSSVGR